MKKWIFLPLALFTFFLFASGCVKEYSLSLATTGEGLVNPGIGSHTYKDRQSVSISATPSTGWKFDGWSGDISDNSMTVTINMDTDKNVTAHFSRIRYSLTSVTSGNGTINLAGGVNTYDAGTTVNLAATPASGWKFDGWSGAVSESNPTLTVHMDSNKNVTANFSRIRYTLAIDARGNGTTDIAAGSHAFDAGTTIDLTATPATGWKFDGWSGSSSARDRTITVNIDSNKNITANFSRMRYTLDIATKGSGITNIPAGSHIYDAGTTINVTATPASGWKFDGWSGAISENNPTVTINMDSNKNVAANFSRITYALTLNIRGGGITNPKAGAQTYDQGTLVNITATPDYGWIFDRWTGDVATTSAMLSLSMSSNKTVTANFVNRPPEITQVSQTVGQVSKTNQLVFRNYQWVYGGKKWTWELQLPQALYDYYKGLPRSPTRNYSVYVTHPLDDTYINLVAEKLGQIARQQGFSEFQKVSFASAFVQSLPYTRDSVTARYDEYPRYPIETLVDNGGDCEDTAILTASLLRAMGYGTVLIILPGTVNSEGHAAVGVKGGEGIYGTFWEFSGGKYFYLETTGDGWEIGQIPDEYKNIRAQIYDMTPVPIFTHEWTARSNGNIFDVDVKVTNLGTAPAQGMYVLTGFDAGDNKIWNPQNSPPFQLGVDQSVTVNFKLTAPQGKHTRLLVQIAYGNSAVDESYSKWFDT